MLGGAACVVAEVVPSPPYPYPVLFAAIVT